MRLGKGIALAFLLALGSSGVSFSQPVGLNDPCRHAKANESGTARADITVSTAAVDVIATNEALCGALIVNTSLTNPVRCTGVNDGAPTATAGLRIPPGSSLALGLEAQDGWKCIRDTTATGDVAVNVMSLYR